MKTKIFAFLATVGVARGIFLSFLTAVLLLWAGLTCALMYGAIAEMSIMTLLFLSSVTLIIFGGSSKVILDMLSWKPQVIKPKERWQKNLDIVITLGLANLAVIIFMVYYYEETSIFTVVVLGITELWAIYLFHKNGLFGSWKFFVILLISLVIFVIHTLIIQYYFGRHDESGSGTIMLVGFYIGLIALTKIPERIYQSWIKPRIEKKLEAMAEKKKKDDALAMFSNVSLFNLGNMYIYFATIKSGNEELNKKQKELYLEAFLARAKSGKKMDVEDTKYICYLVGHANYKLYSEFLNAVADQCLLNNISYLVFTTGGQLSVNEWPMLFKVSNKKAELVSSYLDSLKHESYNSMFNESTLTFNVNAFTGLVNCLSHFYKKSDDDLEKNIAKKELQKLFIFAADCCERMNFIEPSKQRLQKRMEEIKNEFWEIGIE